MGKGIISNNDVPLITKPLITKEAYMPDCNNCPYIERISRVESSYQHSLPVITAMNGKLDVVILSLGKIEVLESKHNNHSEALGRAFERIEAIEKQTMDTSKAVSDLLSQIKGMTRLATVLWTVMGASVGFIFSKVL